jgi:TrbL/VirB6 plasmid conjugal transfer protein
VSFPNRRAAGETLLLVLAFAVASLTLGIHAQPARAQLGPIPNPCDLPGPGYICDAVGDLAGDVAGAAGDFVMRGVTVWVTNAAVWVAGKVGELIDATASPDVEAGWFARQYQAMLGVAGLLALPMLLLAVIQALIRQDIWILLRSAFGYLPMAFILAGAAIVGTALLVSIVDYLSVVVTNGLGSGSRNLLQSVGNAYSSAIKDDSGGAVPLFGVFLGAIILAIGAFVLWLEMVIRDAAIYIALFFLPLTFVAMIWPATSRYARRLVEFLVAVILAKLVIVAIIGLASGAITNEGAGGADGQVFERMMAGAALLVLAAWSPFALLRLIPMMEVAAASVVSQRSSMSGAAGSAGIHSPASYMRQAMDRHSRPSASPAYAGTSGTMYTRVDRTAEASPSASRSETRFDRERVATTGRSRLGEASGGTSGATAPPTSRGREPKHQPSPPNEPKSEPPLPPESPRRPPEPPSGEGH